MAEQITFEQAINELEQTLERLSDEETTLDESVELYARAAELVVQCKHKLDNAKIQVDEITEKLSEAEDGI